ncbi:Abi family protein [Duncaniella sp.]|uniref:Abi family protein n=1 Tax=Duncaniella sp. TaxID=2518496 RepID=UPI0023D5A8C7|nr:Abi family protein [Duncaniella sp.]MDE5903824.1 Abi family protein [Duncaniella sp.]
MTKSATTIDRQLGLLESRGLAIADKDKAREILLDIGYYRLGFYLFPFEKSYPDLRNRTHEYIEGASFEDAVNLYYFDFDLRLLLMRYLNRIEIAFRTSLIYHLSNKYNSTPIWFVSPSVVGRAYARDFESKVYTPDFKRNPVIRRHHQKNPDDRFAPSWKTLEFMTFGAVMKLYEQLKDREDKIFIAHKFGIRQVVTFESYMHTIRQVRNACAHGLLLYDLRLPLAIRRGPAAYNPSERNNIIGALRVIKYVMERVSANRADDMGKQIKNLYEDLCSVSPKLKPLIPNFLTI